MARVLPRNSAPPSFPVGPGAVHNMSTVESAEIMSHKAGGQEIKFLSVFPKFQVLKKPGLGTHLAQLLPLALPHLQLLFFRLGTRIQCLAHLPEPQGNHGDSSYPRVILQSSGLPKGFPRPALEHPLERLINYLFLDMIFA